MAVPGYEGFAALGDLVAGGADARASKEFLPQFQRNATAMSALELARKRRSEAIAADMMVNNRGALTPELVTRALGGDEAALGELGAVTMGMSKAQPNFGTFTNGVQDVAGMSIERQRQEALEAGNIPQYNRLTALGEGEDYQPARVVGGNVLPDGVALGDPEFSMTPLPQTAARIGATNAGAEAALIRANRPPAAKGLTPVQAEARMELILAQAEEHRKKGKPDSFVRAFINNEAAKAGIEGVQITDGIEPEPGLPPLDPTSGADAALPALAPRVKATRAWSADEVEQAIDDARRAVATGRISKEAARQRLFDAGLTNAAGRL